MHCIGPLCIYIEMLENQIVYDILLVCIPIKRSTIFSKDPLSFHVKVYFASLKKVQTSIKFQKNLLTISSS